MYIAGLCYKRKFFASAVEWAEAAQQISSQQTTAYFITQVKQEHDLRWKSPDGKTFPNKQFFVKKFGDSTITGRELRLEEDKWLTGSDHIFNRLCRGEQLGIGGAGRGNMCRLTHLGVSHLRLSPVKLEELSNHPILHVFHQVLTTREISLLKISGYKQGFDTAITGYQFTFGNEDPKTDTRIQANVWLEDDENEELHKLSKKTGEITGLECARNPEQLANPSFHQFDPAEAFQVGVYPPGGHYLRHHDSHNDEDPSFLFEPAFENTIWSGNRVATLMYYLSSVHGGRTAFPSLGLSVSPEEGTAVFWFNLDSRGAKDNRMIHGACPTALGVKWVSNKWISEGAQIWRRPCTNSSL